MPCRGWVVSAVSSCDMAGPPSALHKGRRRRTIPIIDPLRPTLVRLTAGRRGEERLVLGPRGGVITTATLREATGWDALVTELGQPGLVRHGLRHTALTWMADAGVDLHILQRSPAIRIRRSRLATCIPMCRPCWTPGQRFSAWWSVAGPERSQLGVIEGGKNAG
jgi:hypothetical protein